MPSSGVLITQPPAPVAVPPSGVLATVKRRAAQRELAASTSTNVAAIALAEADCTVQQIMAITGHKTWKEAMRYTQRRDQKKLAQQALDKLEVANSRTIMARMSG